MKRLMSMRLIQELDKVEFETFEHCLSGKMSKKPFPKGKSVMELLDVIHIDICGPREVKTHGRKEYFITLIYDYSGYGYIYLTAIKNEAISIFDEY